MIFLLCFAGLGLAGLFLLVQAVCFAPEGEEDAEGFHFTASSPAPGNLPNRSPLSPMDIVFFN